MSRTQPSVEARIRMLRESAKRAEKFKANEKIKFVPMRKLLGVSRPTLSKWVADIPAVNKMVAKGGMGNAYEFPARRVVAALIKHFEAKQKKLQAQQKKLTSIVSDGEADDAPAAADLKDTEHMLKIVNQLRDLQKSDGKLVEVEKVTSILNALFPEMLRAGLAAPQDLDPHSEWTPGERQAAENAVRHTLAQQQRVVEQRMAEFATLAA